MNIDKSTQIRYERRCVDCDAPAEKRCRRCGADMCKACAKTGDNECFLCREEMGENEDYEYGLFG